MSVNKYERHVLVLPEDDANRQIANGFLRNLALAADRIQILPEAGGWRRVLERFRANYVHRLEKYTQGFMILLIDFDRHEGRLDQVKAAVPEGLATRVFVLGAWTEPEELRRELGPYETIGRDLAQACSEETNATWDHELLRHNSGELGRLREHVRPILFP